MSAVAREQRRMAYDHDLFVRASNGVAGLCGLQSAGPQ
jgi:hypothetical protein